MKYPMAHYWITGNHLWCSNYWSIGLDCPHHNNPEEGEMPLGYYGSGSANYRTPETNFVRKTDTE